MGIFATIPQDAIDHLQIDAGVLLTEFDPTAPYTAPSSSNILAITTGGINPICEPTYEDFFADIDNAPNNVMEGKKLTGWNCRLEFTSLKFNADNTAWALGAADTTTLSGGGKKIVPRAEIKTTDFKDLWWVGDKLNGGAYAVCLKNALSTGGLNIQSTKNGKGQNKMTITGHVSLSNINAVPMEFYDFPAQGE